MLLVPKGHVHLLAACTADGISFREVHQALYDGDLKASAILSERGVREIPQYAWNTKAGRGAFDTGEISWGPSSYTGERIGGHVVVDIRSLTEWLSARQTDLEKRSAADISTGKTGPNPEAAAKKALLEMAKKGPPPEPKKGLFNSLQSQFPGLSRRGFDRAWTAAVEANPDWGLAGRKPKKS